VIIPGASYKTDMPIAACSHPLHCTSVQRDSSSVVADGTDQ